MVLKLFEFSMALTYHLPSHPARALLCKSYPELYVHAERIQGIAPAKILFDAPSPAMRKWWKIFDSQGQPLEEFLHVLLLLRSPPVDVWSLMNEALTLMHTHPVHFSQHVTYSGFAFDVQCRAVMSRIFSYMVSSSSNVVELRAEASTITQAFALPLHSVQSGWSAQVRNAYLHDAMAFIIERYSADLQRLVIDDGVYPFYAQSYHGLLLQDRLIRQWDPPVEHVSSIVSWLFHPLSRKHWGAMIQEDPNALTLLCSMFDRLIDRAKTDPAVMARVSHCILDYLDTCSQPNNSSIDRAVLHVVQRLMVQHPTILSHARDPHNVHILPPEVYWSREQPSIDAACAYLRSPLVHALRHLPEYTISGTHAFISHFPKNEQYRLIQEVIASKILSVQNEDDTYVYYTWCRHEHLGVRAHAVAYLLEYEIHAMSGKWARNPFPFLEDVHRRRVTPLRVLTNIVDRFLPEWSDALKIAKEFDQLTPGHVYLQLYNFVRQQINNQYLTADTELDASTLDLESAS